MLITPADYKAIVRGSELLDDSGAQIFNMYVRPISEGVICGDEDLLTNSLHDYIRDFSEHFELVKGTFLRPESLKKAEVHIDFLRNLGK